MPLTVIEEVGAAALKAGLYGPQGSGKSRTAAELAIGLHQHIGSTKPVAFIDSEQGSDFLLERFQRQGIKLAVDKTRSFQDMTRDLQQALGGFADIVIVDSISHFWRELMRSYLEANRRKFMRIQDWGPLKKTWDEGYTRLYLDSPLHIIMCGRSANIFEDVEDDEEDGGAKPGWKARKVGTKMSAEGETGYEPHLLVEMTRQYGEGDGTYTRVATVVKERFGILDGKSFTFTEGDKDGYVFQCFKPHIARLAIGGTHRPISAGSSAGMFTGNGAAYAAIQQRRVVELELIEGLVTRYMPGTGPKDRSLKMAIYEAAFGTTSWAAIQNMDPAVLRDTRPLLQHLMQRAIETPPEGSPDAQMAVIVVWRDEWRTAFEAARAAEAAREAADDIPEFAMPPAAPTATEEA